MAVKLINIFTGEKRKMKEDGKIRKEKNLFNKKVKEVKDYSESDLSFSHCVK